MQIQDRITCSVRDALDASGLGKTKFYALIARGQINTIKIDGKRLIRVDSLLQLLGTTCGVDRRADASADHDEAFGLLINRPGRRRAGARMPAL
jgi:hypothetical protein